jgi:hypothetical protein
MVLHDRVFRYRAAMIADREIEGGLAPDERAQVIRLLGTAINILSGFGATPTAQLARLCHDDEVPARVNDRVAKIIASV